MTLDAVTHRVAVFRKGHQHVPTSPPQTMGSILLQTREGTDILNTQASELTNWDWHCADKVKDSYGNPNMARYLSGPCPLYDCNGLTLASRRTSLDLENDLCQILKEDGYEEVVSDDPQPGDLVMYVDEQDGHISHTGFVAKLEPDATGSFEVPWVWSKWGKGHEVLHHVAYCPYMPATYRYFRMTQWQ